MTHAAASDARPEPRTITVAALAWAAVAGMFVIFRFAALLAAPVGGVELDSLAGAWEAHASGPGDRFIPTLFQALTSWSFAFASSETPARLLAFLASCSVPFALYRLRPTLGELGALTATLVLALDPVTVLLGGTAWHGGFDVALVAWLLVAVREEDLPHWALAVAGFLLATAGALVLPVVLAFAAVRLFRQAYPPLEAVLWAVGGVAIGGIVAANGFGYGLQDPTLPPIFALARGFEAHWSTSSTGALTVFYSLPVLAIGAASAVFHLYQCWRDDEWPEWSLGLLLAGALALAWVIASSGSHDPVPLAAATLPLALIVGMVAAEVVSHLVRVAWLMAGPVVAGILFLVAVAIAYVVDWARIGSTGDDRDRLIITGLVIALIASAALLASSRRTAAALVVAPTVVAAGLLIAGAAGAAFGGPTEPLPSPITTVQGREVRDIVLKAREERGGLVVVHSDFREVSTWPLRDSGEVVYASRVPEGATAVVWPVTLPAPEGFSVIEGRWSFEETRPGPDGGFLDYLRWLTNRNVLRPVYEPLAIYLRSAE